MKKSDGVPLCLAVLINIIAVFHLYTALGLDNLAFYYTLILNLIFWLVIIFDKLCK